MRRLAAMLFVFLLAAPGAPTGAAESGDVVARVQDWLDSWTTLAGRFEQILVSPTLPSAQVESGRFQVARPDRMRWDYRRPEEKLAVSDGVHTWLYLPEDRQVIRGTLARLRRDSAVSLLLSGSLRLEEAFTIREARVDSDEIRLTLVPIEPSESIDSVTLRADPDSGSVRGFTIIDPTGNEVSWNFSDLKADPRLDRSLFTFRIPEGVEVQDIDAGGEAAASAGPVP